MRMREQAEGPRPVPVKMADQVAAAIRRLLGGQVSELRVVASGGGLVLQGRSRTHHAKQLAQHAAAEMSGLMIVANEIKV